MDSIISDGLYFPFVPGFSIGGQDGGCPETPMTGPLKPDIDAKSLSPTAAADSLKPSLDAKADGLLKPQIAATDLRPQTIVSDEDC